MKEGKKKKEKRVRKRGRVEQKIPTYLLLEKL